jgi:outer membrane protein TolC
MTMTMTNLNWMRTSRRTLATTLAVAGLAATPLSAQQGRAPQQQVLTTPQAPPQGETLRLTMTDAVTMALEMNLQLKSDRMDVDVAAQGVAGAKSVYLPVLTSNLNRQSGKSVPSDFTQGLTDITSRGLSVSATLGQQVPWYGGNYSVSWQGSRNDQVGGISSFNPRLSSFMSLNFTQPLLQDLRIDSQRFGVQQSERLRAIADLTLQQRLVQTEAQVKNAYLSLIAAVEGRKVAQQNMDIAEKSLQNAKARVAVGQSPQIDVIQADARVAGIREGVIAADGAIGTAEDNLRQLILDPNRPDYWTVHLEATDTIQLTPFQVDVDAAIKNALANRLDLISFKRNMEITDLRMNLNKNATLPSIDFNARYSAQGTAGTQFEFGSGFPPPITSRTDRSFGSALGDTILGAYPSWQVGVTVGYPIGQTGAKVAVATTQIQKRQQELDLHNFELQVVRDVREAARQVRNSFERVQAAVAAREASEAQLRAVDRQFEVGIGTTLDQQVRQQELATALNRELAAKIDYNRALINLERVQKIQ